MHVAAFVKLVFVHCLSSLSFCAMDCLPQRPPGPVTKQIPRLDEAISSLEELQQSDEIEAAMSLLMRLIAIDESIFCAIFQHLGLS